MAEIVCIDKLVLRYSPSLFFASGLGYYIGTGEFIPSVLAGICMILSYSIIAAKNSN